MTPLAPVSQFDRFGGMNYDVRPFLVGKNEWRLLHNMRTMYGLSQVPPHANVGQLITTEIQKIVNLPTRDTDYGLWLALETNTMWQLRTTGSVALQVFADVGTTRWETCVYDGRLYFVNDNNQVRWCNGARVADIGDNHIARAVPHGMQLIGDGPFSQHPAYDSEPDGIDPTIGDLGTSFSWTINSYYRVYHAGGINYFPVGAVVRYRLNVSSSTILNLDGFVVSVYDKYIVVKASNTLHNVPNTAAGSMGWVYLLNAVIPCGRYVSVFYDHLVVGAPTFRGTTMLNSVMWSHLYDFTDWQPRIGNEADKYDCTFMQRDDSVIDGVTGMQLMKAHTIGGLIETMLIFTSSCVYAMSYTGLPRVVRVSPLIKDYGNGLLHATASLDDSVVWCDVNHGDFMVYRGQGPESIGGGIRTYFFNDLNTDSDLAQKTWSYVDRLNFEVVWVYVSNASATVCDKAIAFNYSNKTWSVRDAPGLSAFGRVQRRAKIVEELTGVNSAQTATNAKLARSADSQLLLWGTSSGYIQKVAGAGDTMIGQTSVLLETGDLLYGSAQKVKEVSAITINATATVGFTGVVVEVCARESVDTAVTWFNAGVWTSTLPEKMLTFMPQAGKVLRYRFSLATATAVRGFVFSGFEDNVRGSDANR